MQKPNGHGKKNKAFFTECRREQTIMEKERLKPKCKVGRREIKSYIWINVAPMVRFSQCGRVLGIPTNSINEG